MDFTLNDEQKLMAKSVRQYMEAEIKPLVMKLDHEREYIHPHIGTAKEMGLLGLMMPEKYGGLECDAVTYCAVVEEVSRVCPAMGILISVHNSVGNYPIYQFGTERQKDKYLPGLSTDKVGAMCLTEPNAGSDAGALATTATKVDGGFRLNGSKVFVTNGDCAWTYIIAATTAPSKGHKAVTAFIVERDNPGLIIHKHEEKMGIVSSDTVSLTLDDCFVPEENVLGPEGDGFKIAMISLDAGRVGVGAQCVGIATGAMEEAVVYSQQREQFGRPISSFQAIQWMLADMSSRIEAARALTHRAAWMKDRGKPYTKEASAAKLYASEAATFVAHRAVQIHGGYGYMREYAVERFYRDARVTEIYEGTNEMQRLIIARNLLSKKKG
jgi:alkylation response protein AidB-like acyl-CoA dehydrogenase